MVILNRETLLSVRNKINDAFSKLVPATTTTDGLLVASDKIKVDSFDTHDHNSDYSNIDHNHDTIYALIDHNHIDYAPANHNHDTTYALTNHNHIDYSPTTHNHNSIYSTIDHNHDTLYSNISHTHVNFASLTHVHDVLEIENLNSNVYYNVNKNKLIVGFAGDSIGQGIGKTSFQSSFLAWAMFTDHPMNLYWDDRLYVDGGYNFAVGGANTATILETQLPQIQARTPDVLFINGGTNNGLSNLTQVTTAISEMTSLINGAINAGVQLVIVYPIIPRRTNDGNTISVQSVAEYNRRLNQLKSTNVFILNSDPLLSNHSSKYHIPKGVDGEFEGVSTDGVHLSLYGNLVQKDLVKDIFPKSNRIIRATNAGDSWNATYNPNGNVLGSDGLMFDSGGELNGVSGNANVAKGWKLVNTGGLLVTPSLTTTSSGFKAQSLVLLGTPIDTSDEIKFSIVKYNSGYFTTNTKFDFECVVSVTGFENLPMPEIVLLTSGGSPTFQPIRISGGFGSGITKSNFITGNYTINAYNPIPIITNSSNRQFELQIKIGGFIGLPISGTITISNVGIFGYT